MQILAVRCQLTTVRALHAHYSNQLLQLFNRIYHTSLHFFSLSMYYSLPHTYKACVSTTVLLKNNSSPFIIDIHVCVPFIYILFLALCDNSTEWSEPVPTLKQGFMTSFCFVLYHKSITLRTKGIILVQIYQ